MERTLLAVATGLITMTLIVGCSSRIVENPSDADIMQARSYLADFERRMEKIDSQMKVCYTFSEMGRFNRCKASVYDSVGFDYDVNTELRSGIKDEIENYKRIAFMPLTTE